VLYSIGTMMWATRVWWMLDDLTLYDGSMGEWARDQNLPVETG
jgi:thiosulfate/3-mercaptopyruvate sulfurtransferase